MNELSRSIQSRISALENKEKAQWLERYVKHNIKSLGVGIPEIRKIVKDVDKACHILAIPIAEQEEMLNDLMKKQFTEFKLAAILYIQTYWKKADEKYLLDLISKWFDNNWISDWNVCDWLCVRLLSPLIDTAPHKIIPELEQWNGNHNLWKARASLVPFAQCKSLEKHKETIYKFSVTLIQREERFCKTAVGWVLRQYSKVDDKFVITFLNDCQAWTTKEVIKNVTKYLLRMRQVQVQ